MTIKESLLWAKDHYKKHNIPSHEAEELLCHVLGVSKTELITKDSTTLLNDENEQIIHFVQERISGKPTAYIIGKKEFFGREFIITEDVLIPREETEELLEHVCEYVDRHAEVQTLIDVGTGSGCIAVSLALLYPQKNVIGSDLSQEALVTAFKNKTLYNCSNLELVHTDLLKNMESLLEDPKSPSIIVANLPYIPEHSPGVQDSVKDYEPHSALYSGPDGLDHYRRLFKDIHTASWNIQRIFLEIDESQRVPLSKLLERYPEWTGEIHKDLSGLDRFAIIDLKEKAA